MSREPTHHGPADGRQEALLAALIELEHHVADAGWDQPPRLFALVPTVEFMAAEPALARDLGLRGPADGGQPDALTAIEQEHFEASGDLARDLAGLEWPATVFGCAVSTVRTFLPAGAEAELPDDPSEAARVVADHPARREIRVVVGADRAGHRHGVARLATHPDELLAGEDLVPGLADAVAQTLT